MRITQKANKEATAVKRVHINEPDKSRKVRNAKNETKDMNLMKHKEDVKCSIHQ